MDILEAANNGCKKEKFIKLYLRNLTPVEFRKHSFLDSHLDDSPNNTMIYFMQNIQRLEPDDVFSYNGLGDIIVNTNQNDKSIVTLSISPFFKTTNCYEQFITDLAENVGSNKDNIVFMPEGIYDEIINPWSGLNKIGHKEIADVAKFFDNSFVKVHEPDANTLISAGYRTLKVKDVLSMKYSPENVISFNIY